MIYFTSDLHLDHDKDFIYKERGFDDIHSHNLAILNNWNSVVTPDDTVYILGDLMLGDNSMGTSILNQLNGIIHIILGNHDTDSRIALYKTLPQVADITFADRIRYRGYSFFLSHYPMCTGNGDKELKRAIINLHGHTHQKINYVYENGNRMYHVGVDSHNMQPISIDDIITEIIEKEKA